jgi:hypothetical protein
MAEADSYNYSSFTPEANDLLSFPGIKPGEKFPDACLETLRGTKLCLSDFHGQWLVIESGSITCPHYIANIDKMNEMAHEFPQAIFLVVYVRETHPGEKIPAHKDYVEKRRLALMVHEEENENRIMIVDTIHGEFHQFLGNRSNSIFVLNPEGVVVFRSDWNNPRKIHHVLTLKNDHHIFLDDHYEPQHFPITTVRILLRAGYKALWHMIKALPKLIWLHQKSRKIKRFKT